MNAVSRFFSTFAQLVLYVFMAWMTIIIFVLDKKLPISMWVILSACIAIAICLSAHRIKSKKNRILKMEKKVSTFFSSADFQPEYALYHVDGNNCWAFSPENEKLFIFSNKDASPLVVPFSDILDFHEERDIITMNTKFRDNPVFSIKVPMNKKSAYCAHILAICS